MFILTSPPFSYQIWIYSYIFISGYGQLQDAVETFMGISLMIVFFAISTLFFLTMYLDEKHHKWMYIVATVCGIYIAILIAMNFIWPLFFGLPAF